MQEIIDYIRSARQGGMTNDAIIKNKKHLNKNRPDKLGRFFII